MRTKNLRSFLCMVTAVAMGISSMFSAPPIRAVPSGVGQDARDQRDGSDTKQPGQYDCIKGLADETLYDTDGNPIRACGGEVHEVTEDGETKWYWFGEDVPGTSEDGVAQGLHLYSSEDLYNWVREEDSFRGMTSKEQFETDDYFKSLYGDLTDEEKDVVFECLKNCPTAHPKVFYNMKTCQYVMWVPGTYGKMCIATSKSIKGPFKFEKYCEGIVGFAMAYQDEVGTAYVVYQESTGQPLMMASLTEDYMDISSNKKAVSFSGSALLGAEGAMFERDGRYYMVNAGTKQYAVADSLNGTWAVHSLQMCDEEGKLCGDSQMNPTSCILQVNTESGTVFVNIADQWDNTTIDQPEPDQTRYIWLPLMFSEDGTVNLRQASNWSLEGVIHKDPTVPPETSTYDSIDGLSGEILYDTEGRRVYACGGEVHQVEENGETKWYWFGVDDLESDSQSKNPGIHLYSSEDLYNWEYEGVMDNFGSADCLLAHPKVLYNNERQEYVMWVSGVDGTIVATSKSIKGPFVRVEGTNNNIAGFFNLYQESDGNAYIIYTSVGGLNIAKLSADYTKIEGVPQAFRYTDENVLFNAEGGVFEKNGKYYIINAGNPGIYGPQYAEADSLSGPWTVHKMQMWDDENEKFENIVDKNQTSNVFHVKSGTVDTYVCVGDSVNGSAEMAKVRYIWLPIKFFEDGMIALEKLSNWRLGQEGDVVEVAEVTLTETSKTLKVGDAYQITAGVLPADATDQTLTYMSSDESVASVSASGQVVAEKTGETTITVTSVNGKTAQLRVTVVEAEGPTQQPAATAEPTQGPTLQPGATEEPTQKPTATTEPTSQPSETERPTQKPTATAEPTSQPSETEGPTQKPTATAEPTSQPSETEGPTQKPTATTEPTQEPTATAEPTQKPTATAEPTQKPTATTKLVDEKPPVKVTRVILTEKSATIKVGDTYQINAVVLPTDATDKGLTYKSSDESVATVSASGKVVAVKAGKAIITVTAADGKMEQMQLTVEKKPAAAQRILVSEKSVTMGVGETVQLEAVVYPKNASNKKLTYRASNNKVEVNGKGKVTARKAGTCKITISLPSGEKAVVKVTVKKKPSKLRLNAGRKTLKVGKKFQIKARLPKGTASYKMTFVSSKETVAAVSKSGRVTAKKKGNAVIVVKTYNGIRAVLKIHVK